MNYTKGVKLKRISLILALVIVLALSVVPYTAFASKLEAQLDEAIHSPVPSLSRINSITGPIITEGSNQATTIMAIQTKLVSLGYDTGGIDGIMGPKTTSALLMFQKSRNLKVDGIVGPQTRAALGL